MSVTAARVSAEAETQTDRRRVKSATFFVGDSTDEDSDADTKAAALVKGEMLSVETQTEELEKMKNQEPRPPRPVQECSAILKLEVSVPNDYSHNCSLKVILRNLMKIALTAMTLYPYSCRYFTVT
jgi:hypothetical protein